MLSDFASGRIDAPPANHPTGGTAGETRGQYITHRITLPAIAADGDGYSILFNPHYSCANTILGDATGGVGSPTSFPTISVFTGVKSSNGINGTGSVTLPTVLAGQYATDGTYGMGIGRGRFIGARLRIAENATSANLGGRVYLVDSDRALVSFDSLPTVGYKYSTVADLQNSTFNTQTTTMNVVTGKSEFRFVPSTAADHEPAELVQWVNTVSAAGATATSVQNQDILPPLGQRASHGYTKALLLFPFALAASAVTFTVDLDMWHENIRFTPGASTYETVVTVPHDKYWFSNPSVIAANVNAIAAIKEGRFDRGGAARLAAGLVGEFAPSAMRAGRGLLSRYTGGGSELAIKAGKYLVSGGMGSGMASNAQLDYLMSH